MERFFNDINEAGQVNLEIICHKSQECSTDIDNSNTLVYAYRILLYFFVLESNAHI